MKKILTLALMLAMTTLGALAAKVDTVTVPTANLPVSAMKVTVVTPTKAKSADGLYPTVYLLNGYDGNYRSWIKTTQPRLPELADQYGVVFVCPDGMDSWYFDAPANPKMKMETFFTTDLVPYIDNHFPTRRSAGQRAISGFSMGGHGAMWLGLRHPDIWKNVGSMSGGVNIQPFGTRWKIPQALGKNPTADTLRKHSVCTVAKTLKPGQNNIIFDCGQGDFFYTVNADLHNQLVAQGIPHEYTSRPGVHSHKYWANSVIYHLMFFTDNFKRDAAKK